MTPRKLAGSMVAAAALALTACGDMPVEPSLLEGPRILAIKATPRTLMPGGEHQLELLAHDVPADALSWRACPAPWVPEGADLVCPTSASTTGLDLGSGTTLTMAAPEDVDAWWLLVDAGELTTPAVLELSTGEAADHPSIDGIEAVGADGLSVPAGGTLDLRAVMSNRLGRGKLLTSFFTQAGLFEPWRTFDGAPTTFEAPEEPGAVEILVVIRDESAGVDWRAATIEVTP